MKLLLYIFGIAAFLYGILFIFLGNEGMAVIGIVAGASLIFAGYTQSNEQLLKHPVRRK